MSDTFAAMLTATGRGAISVIRVWGPCALAMVDMAFRPTRGRSLIKTPTGRLRVGRMGAGLGDEVVIAALQVAAQPLELEVQCHGGPVAAQLVLDALVEAGVQISTAAGWAAQVGNSKIATDAWIDLARASTLKTAQILLNQAEGALEHAIEGLNAQEDAEALIAKSVLGLRLVDGWRVALAGSPNVGKSRLMNALAGYGRAIVDPTPGTTRDVVTVRIALDGWPIELADTAGLRETSDRLEATGIVKARVEQARADLILLVFDSSQILTFNDHVLMREYPYALRVSNKSDLAPAWAADRYECIPISAELGDGLEDLMKAIVHRLIPEPPEPGEAVPFRAEQVAHLRSICGRNRSDPQFRT